MVWGETLPLASELQAPISQRQMGGRRQETMMPSNGGHGVGGRLRCDTRPTVTHDQRTFFLPAFSNLRNCSSTSALRFRLKPAESPRTLAMLTRYTGVCHFIIIWPAPTPVPCGHNVSQ